MGIFYDQLTEQTNLIEVLNMIMEGDDTENGVYLKYNAMWIMLNLTLCSK